MIPSSVPPGPEFSVSAQQRLFSVATYFLYGFFNRNYDVSRDGTFLMLRQANLRKCPNMTILQANIAAALNKQRLSENDRQRLEQYARETAPGYCAGCAHICESAVDQDVPISDILRCIPCTVTAMAAGIWC